MEEVLASAGEELVAGQWRAAVVGEGVGVLHQARLR